MNLLIHDLKEYSFQNLGDDFEIINANVKGRHVRDTFSAGQDIKRKSQKEKQYIKAA